MPPVPTPASPLANWNGETLPLEDVRVSVLDRAFLFGDAIYEVLRIYSGRLFLLREHLDRLQRSLDKLRIRTDVPRLETRLLDTLTRSGVAEGTAYLQVTRGVAPRTHHFPEKSPEPNELIYVKELPADPYAQIRPRGARVITLPDDRWGRCDIKSVNLLANCLAAQAAVEADCEEALLFAADDTIVEGSHTSAFAVQQGCIWTAPLGPHLLPGITRALVVQLAARAGIPVVERSLPRSAVPHVDEMFLTGTTSEILPITVVDGRPVRDGRPGPVTQRLAAAYREFVAAYLAEPLQTQRLPQGGPRS